MASLATTQVDELGATIEKVGLDVVGVSIVDIDLPSPDRVEASKEKVLAALEVTERLGGE
jgi:sugar phosphate isomerase/epimerase